MATAIIDGILTRYEVYGSGPPVLMFSPGGFDATVEKWTTQGIYTQIRPIDHLSRQFTCIAFDRRESGASGGRVESVSWAHYVRRARDCSITCVSAAPTSWARAWGARRPWRSAVAHPEVTSSLLLYWPVGGPHYRINSHARFAEHLDYVRRDGLQGVVSLVRRRASRSTRIRVAGRGPR